MVDFCFITGMARTGSTLLDRLLSCHSRIDILSQPLPLLFVEVKSRFLAQRGVPPRPYPLTNYYEELYGPEDFESWLKDYRLEKTVLESALARQKHYSGQYRRLATANVRRLAGLGFAEALTVVLAENALEDAQVVGLKEVFCEEFIPYLMASGFIAVLPVRDPRDVLTSMRYGKGPSYAGNPRPLLFDLRNWRKSVEFAMALEGSPGFRWLRYEDLVSDPTGVLSHCLADFSVEPVDSEWLAASVTRLESDWAGNPSFSEHSGISRDSIGRYKAFCTDSTIAYIESVCGAEMAWLGYASVNKSVAERIQALQRLDRGADGTRPEFPPDFSSSAKNIRLEAERLRAIEDDQGSPGLFVFPRNVHALHRVVVDAGIR